MSNNLNLDQVAEGQDSAEVTINDQAAQLDAAITEVLSVLVDNTNVYVLSSTELRRNFMFHVAPDAPAPSGTITLTVPGSIERGVFVVFNDGTGFDVEVSISGQSEPVVTVADGDMTLVYSDGIDVRAVGSGGGGGGPTTSPFTVTNGTENFVLTVVNGALTTLETDSSFMAWIADADGVAPALVFSASLFAPDAAFDNTITLGDPASRFEALFVGTGTSQFDGDVFLSNQMELRLGELTANGSSYIAHRATASLAGNTTYTWPADGTNTYVLQTNGAGTLAWVQAVLATDSFAHDIASFFSGAPGSLTLISQYVANRAMTLPASFTGSQGFLAVAATAQTDFDIQKNGVSVGTMRFAAAGTVASFIVAGTVTLAAGDRLTVVAPATPDATAAYLSFNFKGTRTGPNP